MKNLLAVFAHPGDESFACGGTLAKYVADGWQVDIVSATGDPAGQKELQKAGTELGVHSVTFLGFKEGTVANETPGEIEEALYKKMLELVPDCIITFDPGGFTNNPDHVRLSYAATFAFQKYAAWIEHRLKDVEPTEQVFPKLYYAVMPEHLVSHLKKEKKLPSELHGRPLTGVPDKRITTVVHITEFETEKKKALSAYTNPEIEIPIVAHEYFILRMHGTTEVFMGKNDNVADSL